MTWQQYASLRINTIHNLRTCTDKYCNITSVWIQCRDGIESAAEASSCSCKARGVSHSFGIAFSRKGIQDPTEANRLIQLGSSLPHKICNRREGYLETKLQVTMYGKHWDCANIYRWYLHGKMQLRSDCSFYSTNDIDRLWSRCPSDRWSSAHQQVKGL